MTDEMETTELDLDTTTLSDEDIDEIYAPTQETKTLYLSHYSSLDHFEQTFTEFIQKAKDLGATELFLKVSERSSATLGFHYDIPPSAREVARRRRNILERKVYVGIVGENSFV